MGASAQQSSGRKAALSEINVTPLVDVMLVLLIIFMITAPMMQQGIDVDLPQTSGTGLDLKEEPYVVIIKKDHSINIASTHVPMAQLQSKVGAAFSTRQNKQIFIQADKEVPYGIVAQAMGEIKAAGISNIGLVTLPKE